MKYIHKITMILLLSFMGVFYQNLPLLANSAGNPNNVSVIYYPTDHTEAVIGKTMNIPVDQPKDNVFQIELPEILKDGQEIYLHYELKGVNSHTGIARSINERQAVGGYFVNINEEWTVQKERIDPNWLKKGLNTIQFSLPENAEHSYSIKNLSIIVEPLAEFQKAIVCELPTQQYYEDKGYLKGYVQKQKRELVKLYANNLYIPTQDGEFEAIITKPLYTPSNWKIELRAVFSDGEEIVKNIEFSKSIKSDFEFKALPKGLRKSQYFNSEQSNCMDFLGATLEIPKGAIKESVIISVTALRDIDVPPLNLDMVNVTGYDKAYRCLPHGTQFEKAIDLHLAYDPNLIPEGYTAKDIKSFYYDEGSKEWKTIHRDTLLEDQNILISKTTHFTDYINGIIKVPESPETQGYAPTSIKDIKAADPSANILPIEPPTATNMGTANLSFPIKIPPGRQGMQPQLAIQYNSEGGNGWLGLGWNLSTPSVSVDTRWGVPRFNEFMETETYSVNGQMLSPVAHRDELIARDADKEFNLRIEGSFQKIIRHGNNPLNYWWEVIDKNGTRNFYGGTPEEGIIPDGVLGNSDGIAHWCLVETRDLNGNIIQYIYDRVENVGIEGGTVEGTQLYIDNIYYTGYFDGEQKSQGRYNVRFITDKDLGETERIDVQINGRLGFKQVTADLLREIEIYYDTTHVRSYELHYREGAFFKNLLDSLVELDQDNSYFYHHSFEYFDEVREDGEYNNLYEDQEWSNDDDDVKGDLTLEVGNFNGEASVLSGSKSKSTGFGLSLSVGFIDGDLASKIRTAGGSFSHSSSKSWGLTSLIDMNGDGLADKLFKKNGGLQFRPNALIGQSDEFGFTNMLQNITDIDDFSHSKTKTNSFGINAHPAKFVTIGYNRSRSTTETKVYFTDFNGDGLTDIAEDGKVYFNMIEDGVPTYTTNVWETPSPIFSGVPIGENLVEVTEGELEELREQNPLHDVVRMWKAPCDGTINITGNVEFIGDISEDAMEYMPKDGICIKIQHDDTELPLMNNCLSGAGVLSINQTRTVQKGNRIYFRLQSVDDGAYDKVLWSPVITYSSFSNLSYEIEEQDANNKNNFVYNAQEDFIVAGTQYVSMPMNGTITIDGNFSKIPTSDSIRLQVLRIDTLTNDTMNFLYEEFGLGAITNYAISTNVDVDINTAFVFKLYSNTNIDWSGIEWIPKLYYTDGVNQVGEEVTTFSEMLNEDGELETDTLFMFCPVVEYSNMYNDIVRKAEMISFTSTTSVTANPQITFDNPISGIIIASLKGKDVTGNPILYDKGIITVNAGISSNLVLEAEIAANTPLYCEFFINDNLISDNLEIANMVVNGTPYNVGVYTVIDPDEMIFGPLYRGWGQFVYNGNGERADMAIMEDELTMEMDISGLDGGFNENMTIQELEALDIDPTGANFIIMCPNTKKQAWDGIDEFTYIKADTVCTSRRGEDNVSGIINMGGTTDENCIGAPIKISEAITNSFSLAVATASFNDTETILDVMDFNGDRYPDVVGKSMIQYTNAIGGLSERMSNTEESHNSTALTFGLSLGGSFPNAKNNNTQNAQAGGYGKRGIVIGKAHAGAKNGDESEKTAKNSVSFNGSLSVNTDKVDHTWMDINGDGLQDKLYRNGNVALNIGYEFLPTENWDFNTIRKGFSQDFGAGLGISINNGSFTGGVGLTNTQNEANEALQDVNGDGLVDLIILNCPDLQDLIALASTESEDTSETILDDSSLVNSALSAIDNDVLQDALSCSVDVRLNTGNGFVDEVISWNGFARIDQGSSTGESINGSITFCFPIILAGIEICFSPSLNAGRSVNRSFTQLSDINGDGFPDYLTSDNDGDLKVKLSTIGKTNMLKKVNRPLGSNFELDYELVGNTYDLPHGKWVLSEVLIFDGFEGDGKDYIASTFEYQNGYQDRHEREFYGFEKVISRQHYMEGDSITTAYRTTIQNFNNDNYYEKGLLIQQYLEDENGNRFTETQNTYQLLNIENGTELANFLQEEDQNILEAQIQQSTYKYAAFPALVETVEFFYEGNPIESESTRISRRMTMKYDNLGNVTFYEDFSDESQPFWQEEYYSASIDYHYIDNDSTYLQAIPSSLKVQDINSVLYRHRETSIDDKGNLTEVRQFLANGDIAFSNLDYDYYGNIIKTTRPANNNGEKMWFSYEYDDTLNTYTTKVTDAYGYESFSKYNLLYGQVKESIDINEEVMRWTYDSNGRIATIQGPYEIDTIPWTIRFEYHPDSLVPYAHTLHYDPELENNFIDTYTFMDGLYRPIQIKKTGVIYNEASQVDQEKMIVSGRVSFDEFGRTIASRYPVDEPLGMETVFNTSEDEQQPTTTTYDVLDRTLITTLPDTATTTMVYDIGADNTNYRCFYTQITDAEGNKKETFADVRERQRATNDIYGEGMDSSIWTQFRYDAISQLDMVVDDGGNITTYSYDNFGRKISRNHPDAGLTEFEYDLASNLIKKITANTRAISDSTGILYNYDFARLHKIYYPTNFQNNVVYHYGDPNNENDKEHKRMGRIKLQEDASGGQEFFYGSLGEITKNIRTILVREDKMLTYVSEYEYDTWNRIQTMTYPDGEEVQYHYNAAGKLDSMSSEKLGHTYTFVDQLSYDKFEQRVVCRYGNGNETTYAYEPDRRRLQNMVVETANSRTIMDNQYHYDLVNNIDSVRNNGTVAQFQLGGPSYHKYEYDRLYRLIKAEGEWTGFNDHQSYSLEMEYDNLHNISSKKQVHLKSDAIGFGQGAIADTVQATTYGYEYIYGGQKPHAPSKIENKFYEYDANGNTTGRTEEHGFSHRQLIWDEEDRIKGIADDGYQNRYTYDAGGERVIKSHGGIQGVYVDGVPQGAIQHTDNYTVYVSPYLVARENGFTKHYYIEGQRFLNKIGTGNFKNNYWEIGGITAGGLDYTDRIRQMQAAQTALLDTLFATPPGEPTTNPVQFLPPIDTENQVIDYNGPPGQPTVNIAPPSGWPQPPATFNYDMPPEQPTVPNGTTINNATVQAGYGFETTAVGNASLLTYEANQFFYHPDHLGSTSYITDAIGEVRQHVEYFPFGETFVEEHSTSDSQPYLFNSKELDRETGLYYYGARYYDPQTSIWQSVDPMADKYQGWSPYNYTLQNPIVFIDPDGRDVLKKIVETLRNIGNLLPKNTKVKYKTNRNRKSAQWDISNDLEITSNGELNAISLKIKDIKRESLNLQENKMSDDDIYTETGLKRGFNDAKSADKALAIFDNKINKLEEDLQTLHESEKLAKILSPENQTGTKRENTGKTAMNATRLFVNKGSESSLHAEQSQSIQILADIKIVRPMVNKSINRLKKLRSDLYNKGN